MKRCHPGPGRWENPCPGNRHPVGIMDVGDWGEWRTLRGSEQGLGNCSGGSGVSKESRDVLEFFFPLQMGFPGLNHCAFVQSLFRALVELQHHPELLQSSPGISFGVLNITPVLASWDPLSWSWDTLRPCPSAAAPSAFADCSLCPLFTLWQWEAFSPYPVTPSLVPSSSPCFLEPLQALEGHS